MPEGWILRFEGDVVVMDGEGEGVRVVVLRACRRVDSLGGECVFGLLRVFLTVLDDVCDLSLLFDFSTVSDEVCVSNLLLDFSPAEWSMYPSHSNLTTQCSPAKSYSMSR